MCDKQYELNGLDNAVTERLFRSLKAEELTLVVMKLEVRVLQTLSIISIIFII